MRGFPSGSEAIQLQTKAGYMYATSFDASKLFPCSAGRTIYDIRVFEKVGVSRSGSCSRPGVVKLPEQRWY
ncbi:hypothetical protein, partial [Mariprofundus erugo]|uniref:hypothetical protein n=1 Tax=Mariprofundus erugo TaxID=2528639 RepID=UPI001EE801F0